jgi:hypothetical protein
MKVTFTCKVLDGVLLESDETAIAQKFYFLAANESMHQ